MRGKRFIGSVGAQDSQGDLVLEATKGKPRALYSGICPLQGLPIVPNIIVPMFEYSYSSYSIIY